MLLRSDRIGPADSAEIIAHSLQMSIQQPYRHRLIRETLRLWRSDLAHLYAHAFADASSLFLWNAGRALKGLWSELSAGARAHLSTLLIGTRRAGRDRQMRWPEHDRPSAYEGVFEHLSELGPVVAMLGLQAYSDPDGFASEYARDIVRQQAQCPAWWTRILRHALEYGVYDAREQVCFAVAEEPEPLPEALIGCLSVETAAHDPTRRVPTLRAVWRVPGQSRE